MARYRRNQAQGVAAPRFNPHLFYATASRVVEMRSRRAYRPVHAGRPRHLSRLPSNRASSLRGSGDTSAASRRNQHHARSYIDLMWRSREGSTLNENTKIDMLAAAAKATFMNSSLSTICRRTSPSCAGELIMENPATADFQPGQRQCRRSREGAEQQIRTPAKSN